MNNLPSARQLFKTNKLANTKRTIATRQRGLYAFRLLLRFDSSGNKYYYLDILNRFLRSRDSWASGKCQRFSSEEAALEYMEKCIQYAHNHYNKLKWRSKQNG